MTKLVLPSGIGDILWALMTLDPKKTYEVEICKSTPKRGKQILDLMPKSFIGESYYSQEKRYPKDCTYSINAHLEAGLRIEEFNGNCNYDLPFVLPKGRPPFLKKADKVYIGIYTSSISANKRWNGWSAEDWKYLIELIKETTPNAVFVGIGAEYDNLMDNIDFDITLRGESLGKVIKAIKNLDCMIGFPSGIPILSEYFKVKTFMFFPDKLDKMQNSFCRKESIGNIWKGCRFTSPEKAHKWINSNWNI